MAGRRAGSDRPVTFVQTPDVINPAMQRAFDVLTGAVKDLQARRLLDLFTSTESGYVPASGTNINAVLHADGVWRTVGSGGSSGVSDVTGTAPIIASPTTGSVVVSLAADGVTDAHLRNSAGTSVIGRASSGTGDPADIVAGSDGDVLRRAGGTLGFGTIPSTSVTGLITSVVAGVNLSGGGTSGSVTLNVIDSPSFAGNVTLGDANTDTHVINGRAHLIGNASARFLYFSNLSTNYGVVYDDGTGWLTIGGAATVGGAPAVEAARFNPNNGRVSVGGSSGGSATLMVARGSGNNDGTAMFYGTTYSSHFNYSSTEDTYIRGGKAGAKVIINDGSAADTEIWGPLLCKQSATIEGNAQIGNGAGDAHTIWGNTQAGVDGTYFSWDDGGNHRLGFVKKAGFLPKLAYGNGSSFSIATSSTAGIDASSSYTDRIVIASGGAVGINVAPTTRDQLAVTASSSAGTVDRAGVYGLSGGTYDATAANRQNYGVIGQSNATKSAGTNSLVNVGLYGFASGGDINYGLWVNGGSTQLDGALSVAGNVVLNDSDTDTTQITGNATIGTHPAQLHTIKGFKTTHDGRFWVTNNDGAGLLSDDQAVSITNQNTFDCTAAALTAYAVWIQANSTRSAGANDLTNIGLLVNAGGAQRNYALYTVGGNNYINAGSGTKTGFGFALGDSLTAQIHVSARGNDVGVGVVRSTASAVTATTNNISGITSGSTADTSGGALSIRGVAGSTTATRSAGTNALTNVGLYGHASGGQVNYALYTANGDILLNDIGGVTTVKGALTAEAGVTLNNTSGTTTIKGATQIQAALDMNSHLINNVTDPSSAQDAATKNYVDTKAYRLLARQVITATGTYTPTTGTKRVYVEQVGAGGGGGGAASGANRAVGGGGGSGVYWAKWIDPGATVTGGAATIGAAGAAGTSAGGSGGTGGDTSIVINGTTYTAKGGTGGTGNTSGTLQTAPGGVPQSGSSTADFVSGSPGAPGVNYNTGAFQWGGNGGSNPMGIGGAGAVTNGGTADAAGGAASGNGAGGGGASATATGRAGAAGTLGLIVVWEYA